MADFSIVSGNTATFVDTTPGGGLIIDFDRLDNGFSVQINGVDLFVGGPTGAPNEVEFQTFQTAGQTVRFADGDIYGSDTPQVWQLGNANDDPIVRLVINPDGSFELFGIKANGGPLQQLELFNGLTANTAAIDAAWNDGGTNTIIVDQILTGPTNARGEFVDIPCFTRGTFIESIDGPIRVEDLSAGDEILTYDHGYQPIRWISSHELSRKQLEEKERLRPILIRADALGPGYPKQDLMVSAQHRILVSSQIAMRIFDREEVLIPANKLTALDDIEVVDDAPDGVTYYHFLCDAHEIVWSNGAATESLFTGPEALKAISSEARQEISELFPECCDPNFSALSARYIPKKGKLMRKLALRHKANQKPLFARNM